WYEENGEPSEAIDHAVAARDFERAADLAEMTIPALFRTRQEATIRRWMKVLPYDVVRVRPVLAVEFVGALVVAGEFEGVEARLRDAEQWLDATSTNDSDAASTEMVVVDQSQFRFLPGQIGTYWAALALMHGDLAGTLAHTQRVLEVAADDDHLSRASAAGLAGLARWTSGDLDGGYQAYADCVEGLRRIGNIADISGCSIALADIRTAQGRLGDAVRVYDQALRVFAKQGDVVLRGTADLHVGLSALNCERDDLHAAKEHLRRSQELGEHNGLPQNPYRWRVAMARIRQAEGDLTGAAELLAEAEGVYVSDFFPNVRPVPAMKARLQALHGDIDAAFAWVRQRGLSVDDDLTYVGEFEHITLARILLARHAAERSEGLLEQATRLLERLLAAAEAGGRAGAVIEILVLHALALRADGDERGALTSLGRALRLAEPEGYVRVFADEGPPMATLLRALAKQGSGSYVRRLLAAVTPTTYGEPGTQRLVDPLSDRELDVLRLLGSDLDGPDIARELTVSLNTMRTHTKNIYAKLGVTNRRAAVRMGQELQLLSRPAPR
ncbi:MAG TPA: LuxR C-terminal-related transcriptional regulator, partial [Acidimicrobiales bacterium]|nr:LuxR C-terminal-related transcriptional regulator [Acidimicrobiales bacterium]